MQLAVNIDPKLKRDFKVQCTKSGKDMTSVITAFVQQVVTDGMPPDLSIVADDRSEQGA